MWFGAANAAAIGLVALAGRREWIEPGQRGAPRSHGLGWGYFLVIFNVVFVVPVGIFAWMIAT